MMISVPVTFRADGGPEFKNSPARNPNVDKDGIMEMWLVVLQLSAPLVLLLSFRARFHFR